MPEDRQRSGESDKDYIRRLMKASSEQQWHQRHQASERAEQQHQRGDANWENQISQALGGDFQKAAKDIQKAKYNDPKVQKAVRDIQKAGRRGNTRKAKRILKSNKGAIKKAAKESNKGWCSFVLLGLMAVFGTGAWGIIEGLSRL